jgi:hypothetical protein
LLARLFGAVGFFGGIALIAAGIVNIANLHDRAGGTTGIVLGALFMLGGGWLMTETLASEPPRWRIRKGNVPQTSNERNVGKHRMNDGGRSIGRRMMLLAILAPIAFGAGVAALLWCRRSEMTYCSGAGGLLATGVFAIIGLIHLYLRRDKADES